MYTALAQEGPPRGRPAAALGAVRTVLVLDDSRAQRRMLGASLSRWGYEVIEAGTGEEALAICAARPVDLVISDWMMPGMDGLEFCRRFRALPREDYGYFILLTSRSDRGDAAAGLDVGADDFLSKPVASDELRARIQAGARIIAMQRELAQKNRLVSETLAEISTLYDAIDRDLIEARKLQQSLVRDRCRDFGAARVSLLLRPAGHVGGDLVGTYPIGDTMLGAYAIDVSGHGIASALMTARLAAHLSAATPEHNVALAAAPGGFRARPPAEVAAELNAMLQRDLETELYLTMLLIHLDLRTGEARMAQCGHPHPIIHRASGAIEQPGEGGLPVGLLPDATFSETRFTLRPGDRLLACSDGVTECPSGDGMLGSEGLGALVTRNAGLRDTAFLEALMWDLSDAADGAPFPDDISALNLEFSG